MRRLVPREPDKEEMEDEDEEEQGVRERCCD